MKKWNYFRLLDREHKDVIVRADGPCQEEYDKDLKKWVRSGIMLHYFSDESDTYDMFEEVSEKEATAIIEGGNDESA